MHKEGLMVGYKNNQLSIIDSREVVEMLDKESKSGIILQNTTDERIKRLDEIALEKIELEEAILGITLKLEETKINQMTLGIMPDTSWLYRAKHALGIKKIQLKKLNIEYEKLKRIFRQERVAIHNERGREFERTFVRVAKELLEKEEFEKIKNLANEITDKQNEVDNVKEVEQKVVKKGTS